MVVSFRAVVCACSCFSILRRVFPTLFIPFVTSQYFPLPAQSTPDTEVLTRMRGDLHPDNLYLFRSVMNVGVETSPVSGVALFVSVKLHRLVSDLTHMEVFAPLVAFHKDVSQGTDLKSPTGFQSAEGTAVRRDRSATRTCADGDGGIPGAARLPPPNDIDGLTSNILQIDGHSKVYSVKKSTILSEPSILCEMLAAVENDGTLEDQIVRLKDVILQDFETLVHFYNEFGSVVHQQFRSWMS